MSAAQQWKIHLTPAGNASSIELARAIKVESSVTSATLVTVQYVNCDAEIEIEGQSPTEVTDFGTTAKKWVIE